MVGTILFKIIYFIDIYTIINNIVWWFNEYTVVLFD